ncbi:MAG: hypothetical protein PHP25_05675, partial [Candidatus Moranbacteria bacterium]|nr:hypothetical protein [Candidatus Moranbacteria bacterium]
MAPNNAWALSQSNSAADAVLGQDDFTHGNPNRDTHGTYEKNLYNPGAVFVAGGKMFVADRANSRVLIYNSIPTSNNPTPDVIVGQPDFESNSANQGTAVAANTLNQPYGVWSDGTKLIISDTQNSRVLIYNSIPTTNNASANIVIGQTDMSGSSANQGG